MASYTSPSIDIYFNNNRGYSPTCGVFKQVFGLWINPDADVNARWCSEGTLKQAKDSQTLYLIDFSLLLVK